MSRAGRQASRQAGKQAGSSKGAEGRCTRHSAEGTERWCVARAQVRRGELARAGSEKRGSFPLQEERVGLQRCRRCWLRAAAYPSERPFLAGAMMPVDSFCWRRKSFCAWVRTCVGVRVPTCCAMDLTSFQPKRCTASMKSRCSSGVQYRGCGEKQGSTARGGIVRMRWGQGRGRGGRAGQGASRRQVPRPQSGEPHSQADVAQRQRQSLLRMGQGRLLTARAVDARASTNAPLASRSHHRCAADPAPPPQSSCASCRSLTTRAATRPPAARCAAAAARVGCRAVRAQVRARPGR